MPQAIGLAIGAFLFSVGAPLAVVNFAVLVLPGILINLGVSIGLTLISAALQQRTNPLPTPTDGQQEIRQPLAPRIRYYGQVRVSGTLWWLDAIGDVLYLGLALNHGRIAEFVSFHINENEVDIDGADKVTTSPYATNNVYLHHRLGLPAETKYSEILTAFGVDEVRGDGIATVLATIQNPASGAAFQNTYHGTRPTIRATIKASVVWDPREGGQDREDQSSWGWSDNPVVCLLNYLLSADGYGIPWARFAGNIDEWKAAAEICDEAVELLAGGTTRRYRMAGGYRLTDAPKDVVAKFCSTCDGRVWTKRDGSIGISVGKYAAPSVTIENDQVVDYTRLMRGQDAVKAIEGIRGEYLSPDHDYREHEAEPWPDGDTVLGFDEDRVAGLDLLWVPSNSQARRLMKRAYLRAKARWRGMIVTNLAGLRAIDERYINLTIDELGIAMPFEVGRFSLDPNALTCEIQVQSIDPAIDDWDPSEEGAADALVFAYADAFSKTGTAVDVLVEAGGVIGQVAYVFAANGTSVPATPAGWALVPGASAGPTSGLAMAVYRKLLDGTEGSITVNGASGAIVVVLMQGMPDPSESDVNIEIGTGSLANQYKEAITAPYATFQFAAATSDFDEADWAHMVDNATKVELDDERNTVHRTGSITAHASVIVYGSDAVPPASTLAYLQTDRGTNGMATFLASPGS